MEISGVSINAFLALLQYLYTDYCHIEEEEATLILVLADKYGLDRLKALCEVCISETVWKASEESIATSVIGKIHCYSYVVMVTIVTVTMVTIVML